MLSTGYFSSTVESKPSIYLVANVTCAQASVVARDAVALLACAVHRALELDTAGGVTMG